MDNDVTDFVLTHMELLFYLWNILFSGGGVNANF